MCPMAREKSKNHAVSRFPWTCCALWRSTCSVEPLSGAAQKRPGRDGEPTVRGQVPKQRHDALQQVRRCVTSREKTEAAGQTRDAAESLEGHEDAARAERHHRHRDALAATLSAASVGQSDAGRHTCTRWRTGAGRHRSALRWAAHRTS